MRTERELLRSQDADWDTRQAQLERESDAWHEAEENDIDHQSEMDLFYSVRWNDEPITE